LEIARQLLDCGAARLVLMSRTRSKGEAAAAQLGGDSCVATFVETDISDVASLQSSMELAAKALNGQVDGLINAGGSTERGNLMNTTEEMFNKQFDTNTKGPFFLTQAVAKIMIATKTRGLSSTSVLLQPRVALLSSPHTRLQRRH